MAKDPKTAAPPEKVAPELRILCRRPGLRRAGVAHDADRTWPAGSFTAAQLAMLHDEPLLTVIEVEPGPDRPA